MKAVRHRPRVDDERSDRAAPAGDVAVARKQRRDIVGARARRGQVGRPGTALVVGDLADRDAVDHHVHRRPVGGDHRRTRGERPSEVRERARDIAALRRRVDRAERPVAVIVVERDRLLPQQDTMAVEVRGKREDRDRPLAAARGPAAGHVGQHVRQHEISPPRRIRLRTRGEQPFDVRTRACQERGVADEHDVAAVDRLTARRIVDPDETIAIDLHASDTDIIQRPPGHSDRTGHAGRSTNRRVDGAERRGCGRRKEPQLHRRRLRRIADIAC